MRVQGKVVVITEASERRSGILDGARPTSEDDTATTFELFFDLVYVFAMTQVTGYMVHAHDALGVLQGLLVLALLWWTWCAYAWLGNQARADTGIVRGAMAVAMAALFVVALTIPEAWDDAEGGFDGPLVLVFAYLLVRCVHLTVDLPPGPLVRRVRAPFPEPSVYFRTDHVIRRRGTRLRREIRCCCWSRADISRPPLLVVDTHTARRV